MIRWAHKYQCLVFNVKYRLAPENKAPCGSLDFIHAFMHLYNNAEKFKVDKSKIVIAGDSGGAHICLGAAYQLIQQDMGHLPCLMILRHAMHSNSIASIPYKDLKSYENYT